MVTQLHKLEVGVITRGHLTKGLDSLREEFAGIFSAETIERFLAEFPKPMTDEVVQAADAGVTMGCGDACPIFPGKITPD